MSKKAVLLINLGTPDHCDPASVRRYLKEFLNDPRVIDLSTMLRWPLVNLLIVPSRYKKSAAAYQKIWQEQGSPLLVNSRQLCAALALELGPDYQVELAMRYGSPSIETALARLKHCGSIFVLPLFPQYSSAATGSAIEKFMSLLSRQWNISQIHIENNFYDHPGFITAFTETIKTTIANKNTDLVLFSYHGLPERHINKSDCHAKCERYNECPLIGPENRYCYRAQCYATTDLIARQLGLAKDQYQVSFQSRLGRTPWIKPYTDLLLPELIKKGIKNIAIVCPSFVADCLETLEEVNIRTREQWRALGGNEFVFVPCINDSSIFVQALAGIIK